MAFPVRGPSTVTVDAVTVTVTVTVDRAITRSPEVQGRAPGVTPTALLL
jgi:hypothetical protein